MRVMVYDVEVRQGPEKVKGGWDNPEGMGFASCVVYDYSTNLYRFFMTLPHGHIPPSLDRSYQRWLKCRAFLEEATLLVGFNNIRFDDRVIWGNDLVGSPPIRRYDILLEYVKGRFGFESVEEAQEKLGDRTIHDGSFSLDGLAEGTLGLRKTGHGAKAPRLWSAYCFDELLEYNLNDVRLTVRLFDFIKRYGFVRDRAGRTVEMPRPF